MPAVEARPRPTAGFGFHAILPAEATCQPEGAVHLLPDEGLSVISDIDDTIKVTHVGRRRKVLRQTFVRDFEAVEGMAELYARWQAAGAAFHYVSRSPWQLYEPLAEFAVVGRLPARRLSPAAFSLARGHTLRADADRDLKQRIIQEMITTFPRRRFVLVGDSGERDPEVYGDIARAFPRQTQAVLIRNTTGEAARGERFSQAFDSLSPDAWQVFDDPSELTGLRLADSARANVGRWRRSGRSLQAKPLFPPPCSKRRFPPDSCRTP